MKKFSAILGLFLLAAGCATSPTVNQIPYINSGSSMVPTLKDREQLVFEGSIHDYNRSDIVLLTPPASAVETVKRIIGLPGEHIIIKDGGVWVNDKKLDETAYLPSSVSTFPGLVSDATLDQQSYFVLGDNRNASSDSRSYGPVPASAIKGLFIKKK